MLFEASDVVRMTELRRSTLLFTQNQPADSIYLVQQGLVKLTRTNSMGSRIILTVRGTNDLVGEEVLASEDAQFEAEAEILTNASVLRISGSAIRKAIARENANVAPLIQYLISLKSKLAEKVELLCLHDVEYRILHYLAELCTLVKPASESEDHQIPITQLELADLIGATRETTSTTLNQLERRGLVKLSRRMLSVSSPDVLRAAMTSKFKSGSRVPEPVPPAEVSTQAWSN